MAGEKVQLVDPSPTALVGNLQICVRRLLRRSGPAWETKKRLFVTIKEFGHDVFHHPPLSTPSGPCDVFTPRV